MITKIVATTTAITEDTYVLDVVVNGNSISYTQVEDVFTFENINATEIVLRATGDYVDVGPITVYYNDPAPATVDVESVTLGENQDSLILQVGGTETLTATVVPENAMDMTIVWSTSDESVATVSDAGVVTAVAAGTTTITATSNADNTKFATCAVTVNNPFAVSAIVSANELTSNGT